jgi:Mg2+/Co2+ transporter CorB
VFAEVSDKEPSVTCVWAVGIIAALVSFTAVYLYKWFGVAVALFPLAWFGLHFEHIYSEDIGAALYAEQGVSYFVQSYLSALLILFGVVFGYITNRTK